MPSSVFMVITREIESGLPAGTHFRIGHGRLGVAANADFDGLNSHSETPSGGKNLLNAAERVNEMVISRFEMRFTARRNSC